MIREFGLFGYPLGHSFSALYFTSKFQREGLSEYNYSLFPVLTADEIKPVVQSRPHLQGFNVTIPHKETIIPYLDLLDKDTSAIGAVNCVKVSRNGNKMELKGYNTDWQGFRQSLNQNFNHTHALVLGTGGSSRAIAFALRQMGTNVLLVSRSKSSEDTITYENLNPGLMEKYTFIVNCTPAGMFPETEDLPPIPVRFIGTKHEVYDLIYNPSETKLLKVAREAGAKVQNGQRMLEIQAELSFNIWTQDKR